MARIETYAAMLSDWQTRMNLVGPTTIPDMWSRHFRDSAQLVRLAPGRPGRPWLDLGSGAGFPALVVALLSDASLHLVEATTKKCAFLSAVIEACDIPNATVHPTRIESLAAFPADIISARACAPLTRLFVWGRRFATPATRWLLPKGARHEEEIEAALRTVSFAPILHPSLTDPNARIVEARLGLRDSRRR